MTDDSAPVPKKRPWLWRKNAPWLVAAGILILLGLAAVSDITGITAFGLRNLPLSAYFGYKDDSLRIVAVYSKDDDEDNFTRGARMAVDKLNAEDGGVLGRKLVLETVAEKGYSEKKALERTVSQTLDLSDGISRTENLLAVVGHEWSDTAVAASAIYSRNKILFLSTHATAQSLTNHDFQTVFALQPDNGTKAQMIANYAARERLSRFLVLSDKTDYGREIASFFTAALTSLGGDLVFRGHVSSGQRSNDQLLMFILDNTSFSRRDFDAIFIVASSVADTADFIARARTLELDVPILGMEYMVSSTVTDAVGKKGMRDVVGLSLYDSNHLSERAQAFAADFRQAYGAAPDLDAALGYDAVALVGDAAAQAGTVDADAIADSMKVARYKGSPFVGVTGPLAFDRKGLVTDTDVFIVRHDAEEFRTVATYRIPLSWGNVAIDEEKVGGGLTSAPSAAGVTD